MIEINLLPGSAKRQKQRLPSFSTGALGSLQFGGVGRGSVLMALAWLVALGLTAFLYVSSSRTLHRLDLDVQAAQRDSVRLHNLRVLNDSLKKQIDQVGGKLAVLQEIDAGRFTWAHILDEVSRTLPQYTWLVNITEVGREGPGGSHPKVRMEGRTGNTFALARYMQELENSQFLRNVTLISQTQVREEEKTLYAFVIEMSYEDPPPDAIQTQPLFTQTGDIQVTGDTASNPGEGN